MGTRAYYNEVNPYAAQWLRNLMAAGLIAPGDVDDRSITEVRSDDLRPYTQCHFFAGIGVWSYALRQAGWPDDQPVWTGSCPCQPFSIAGKGKGFLDEQHLWPVWHELIAQSCPGTIFGEQASSPDGLAWLDLVHSDLEEAGYTFAAVDLCAAGFGAPHIRQRVWFVADRDTRIPDSSVILWEGSANRYWLGHSSSEGLEVGEYAAFCQGHLRVAGATLGETELVRGFWSEADWVWCADGKYRPIEPDTFPLADGPASRVGRISAYGNAITAPVAIEFIQAYRMVRQAVDN